MKLILLFALAAVAVGATDFFTDAPRAIALLWRLSAEECRQANLRRSHLSRGISDRPANLDGGASHTVACARIPQYFVGRFSDQSDLR